MGAPRAHHSRPAASRHLLPCGEGGVDVGMLVLRPAAARCALVLAHGAGAGMEHPFMEGVGAALFGERIATLRFDFPYIAAGRPLPPRVGTLVPLLRRVVGVAPDLLSGLPLLAGGKSMGGRVASLAQAESDLAGVRGLVFLGFPLHPAGRPGTGRADHLSGVDLPTFWVSGTRDALADPGLLRSTVASLGGRATLHEIADADHGFGVPRRSGRTGEDVWGEVARAVSAWVEATFGF